MAVINLVNPYWSWMPPSNGPRLMRVSHSMTQLLFFPDQQRFNQWKQFHRENPEVFRLFHRFAYEAFNSGRSRFSARMIGERIRWYTTVETTDAEYKINDHHWPYYARLMVGIDPRFETFFTFKDQRFDSSIEEIFEFHTRRA